jgi:hypothetical protein
VDITAPDSPGREGKSLVGRLVGRQGASERARSEGKARESGRERGMSEERAAGQQGRRGVVAHKEQACRGAGMLGTGTYKIGRARHQLGT